MPNEMNYIPVPESLKDQLAPEGQEGEAEISYQRVTENGVDYLKVMAVEGQSVESTEKDPYDKMKSKIMGDNSQPQNDQELGM